MDVLWEGPERELIGRAVADAFPEHAYTTVATVLDRLVHKGLLHRRMDGRSIKFAVIGTRGAHTAALMHDDPVASHDPGSALVSFSQTLSPSEAAILRRALKEREARPVPSDQ
jgi:predicted transcriptional regulator